jgi:hypothetical protein
MSQPVPPPPAPVPSATAPPAPSAAQFRVLIPERIVATASQLERRIAERFPNAGLRTVARDLCVVAQEAVATSQSIRRPKYLLRLAIAGLLTALFGLLTPMTVFLFQGLAAELNENPDAASVEERIQAVEAVLGSTVFIGAAVVYLWSLERRWKRERLLAAMRSLRALAHIVDMHQLTKDPETTTRGMPTASSPQRSLTTFELSRYLDYCSEMLSLISKIGAIYVQEFPDPDAIEAADQLANLTNGLSRNIWQKIMILDRAIEPSERGQA